MKKIIILNLLISTLYSQIVWGPDIKISPPQDSLNEYHPRAIAWKDTIHLVYYALHHSQYDIFYMRSTDKGETWEGPINLTINDPDDAVLPWITCWGKKVHVVYQCGYGDSVMYIRSLDGGETWSNPIRLIKPGAHSRIEAKADTLFVISTSQQGSLVFRRSFDFGNNWEPIRVIDTITLPQIKKIVNISHFLHIGIEGTAEWEIFYFRSPDLGNTWEGPFLISPLDNWASQFPSLAVSDSNVYILWMEGMYCSFGAWFN
ncbi:MAG: sialidase family protein, partial [candidate division WOR-3 bacterium]